METLTLIVIVMLYFVPTFVAYKRAHSNYVAIVLSSFFFGWTIVGWIVCLIWACTDNTVYNRMGVQQ